MKAPLAALLPDAGQTLSEDEILNRFVGWVASKELELYPAQEEAILELLEVPHLADRSLTEVSSGEARRLLIGRALVHDPPALLLDEPTNSLDFRAAHELRTIVGKLARSGRTIIMVTHTIADVLPEIGRVILLKDGRIVRDGGTSEYACPVFARAIRVRTCALVSR